ncbi:hypothetical protein GCM10010995_02330 [Cysteiniphilum litorale]|uniref:Uncharacterized protein n=1 Tax=Cysteiniphilum litorale TaxID=2056700 RepID=A0A8J2Z231_9GAMM|nr:hypothetical protein GCM10010995_02330 [Cysteiniphilum litorale]
MLKKRLRNLKSKKFKEDSYRTLSEVEGCVSFVSCSDFDDAQPTMGSESGGYNHRALVMMYTASTSPLAGEVVQRKLRG